MGIGSQGTYGGITAGVDNTRPGYAINNITGQVSQITGGGAGWAANANNAVNSQLANRYGMGQQGGGGGYGAFSGGATGSFIPQQTGSNVTGMFQSPWGTIATKQSGSGNAGGNNFPTGFKQPGLPTQQNNAGGYQTGGGFQVGGGGQIDINGLLAKQQAQNDAARVRNQSAFDQSAGKIRDVTTQYNDQNSKMGQTVQQTRDLVQKMLRDPEAINDNVQAQIQSRAQNQIRAKQEEQQRLMQNQMMQSGQGDFASMQAGRERLGNQAAAESQRTATGLDIQRANQRNQDFMNASNMGQQFTQQDMNANLSPESTVLQNMLYQLPDDYAGLFGALGQFQYGNAAQQGVGNMMSQGGQQQFAMDQFFGSPLLQKQGMYGGGSASTVPGMNPFAPPTAGNSARPATGGGFTMNPGSGSGRPGLAQPIFAQGTNIAGRTDTPAMPNQYAPAASMSSYQDILGRQQSNDAYNNYQYETQDVTNPYSRY